MCFSFTWFLTGYYQLIIMVTTIDDNYFVKKIYTFFPMRAIRPANEDM